MKKLRKHEIPEDRSINMTPMIDVVFQLILFFMLTSSLARPNQIELDLPESTSPAQAADKRALLVTYRQTAAGPEIKLNGEAVAGLDRLGPAMRRLAPAGKATNVDLQIDRSVRFQNVVGVIDTVRDAGFAKFSINTITPARAKVQ